MPDGCRGGVSRDAAPRASRVSSIAPLRPRARVQVRGKRLGQPIGQRLDDDRVVVVVLALEPLRERVGAQTRGDRKRAEVVGAPRVVAAR